MRYFGVYVDDTNDFYTYSDPGEKYNIGDRVMVLFRGRWKSALVVYEEGETNFDFKVLPIGKKMENHISLGKNMVSLLRWIQDYYLCSFSQVLGAAIPGNLKVEYISEYRPGAGFIPATEEEVKVRDYFENKTQVGKPTLTKNFGRELINNALDEKIIQGKSKISLLAQGSDDPRYKPLIKYFEERKRVGKLTLERNFSKSVLEKLLKEGKLLLEKRVKEDMRTSTAVTAEREYAKKTADLSDEQEAVRKAIEESEKKYFLIKGVTGSGKTEVYLKLIKDALEKDGGSIFLVPEISITPQMIDRFKGEFSDNVAILHSKLTANERAREWLALHRGEKKVVLGVRSAIFAPVQNLKYIIIDEEHEGTYKQDSNPRYSAKYVGIKKAELEGAKVVLGSATPSIETYFLAKQGVFELLEMNNRYKGAKLPKLKLVDMKTEENTFFSKELLRDISGTLRKDEQIMLLLNRKGYSTYIQCHDCGHVEECPHCSISMNYYMHGNMYKCNYCGYTKRYEPKCSSCGSENIEHSGKGTEKVEEEIRSYFDTGIIRVDSETSKEKNFYENMYNDFLEKKYNIMLGTQIISKGLHFPDVTMVGVISADTILNFPDFRSGEKTYQLVSQVAGRAGRGEKEGEVLIQTYQPESYVIKRIMAGDYEGLYADEIENRRLMNYPPFSRIINIIVSSQYEEGLDAYATEYFKRIAGDDVEIYGPMKAPIYRIKGRYRYQIFVKGSRKAIGKIKPLLKRSADDMKNNKFRITIDIDPINLM